MSEVLKKIIETKKRLKVPEMALNPHPKMVADHETGVRNAISALEDLKLRYASEIVEKGLYLLVTGPLASEASEEIERTIGVPVYPVENFVKEIASEISPSNYKGKTFGSGLTEMLNSVLTDKAMDLKIVREFNAIVFKNSYQKAINSQEDFADTVRTLLYNERGMSDILAVSAAKGLVSYGIDQEFDGDMMPVVLWTTDSKSIKMLGHLKGLGKGAFSIGFGEEPVTGVDFAAKTVNKTSVTNTFKQIKKQIKTQKGKK